MRFLRCSGGVRPTRKEAEGRLPAKDACSGVYLCMVMATSSRERKKRVPGMKVCVARDFRHTARLALLRTSCHYLHCHLSFARTRIYREVQPGRDQMTTFSIVRTRVSCPLPLFLSLLPSHRLLFSPSPSFLSLPSFIPPCPSFHRTPS